MPEYIGDETPIAPSPIPLGIDNSDLKKAYPVPKEMSVEDI